MKLDIELVPQTAWYANLRNQISQEDWDRLRRDVYRKAGHRCAICGDSGQLSCHEIWEYDDETHIQTLKGFQALCSKCHMVKHIGFAQVQAARGVLSMGTLIRHFMKVNKVDSEAFEQHRRDAFDEWERRSRHPWSTQLGEWASLVKPRPSYRRQRA